MEGSEKLVFALSTSADKTFESNIHIVVEAHRIEVSR
jgi:hypothetical protein